MSSPGGAGTERRLAWLRGGELPQTHNARTIAALASNPGRARRALLDAAATRKQDIAEHAGYPVPFGMSPFALGRGVGFERQLQDDPGGLLPALRPGILNRHLAQLGCT